MKISTIIVVTIITIIWVWISYILYNAPEMDDNGNFIDNIDEEEVYDEKEDVK